METTNACDTIESRVVAYPYGPPRYSLGVKVVMSSMRQVVGWICFVRDGQPTPLGAGYSGVVSPPVRFRPCPGPRSAQHSGFPCTPQNLLVASMLKIQRRQHGHPAALGNPAQPRIPALDLQPRIPTVQWPQDPELLHGSLTQIRTMSQITDPRPQFPSTVKRPGPPFEIQRGLVGIQRGSV